MTKSRIALAAGSFFIGTVAAVFFSACGGSHQPSSSPPDAVPGESVLETELVVYSGRSENLAAPIIEMFRERTGIDVKVKYANTSQLAATLLEEGKYSPADVFFAQDPGGLGATAALLTTLPDEILMLVPGWARSSEGKWVGVTGRARVIVYNTKSLAPEDLPETMEGFTHPKWKGRIGWPPTNASFQTMVTAMRRLWGEERTRAWLEGVQANEPRIYPKNTPVVAAAGSGEIDVGFVNHYYLYRFLKEEGEGFAARNHFLPGNGPGSLVMTAGAGILTTADHPNAAKAFIDFLLSKEAQEYFAQETVEYPLVAGVGLRDGLAPLDSIARPEIDLDDLEDLDGTLTLLRRTNVIP